MPTLADPQISPRAVAIARGLIRTGRATGPIENGPRTLSILCINGGYYWIALNGRRLLRGKAVRGAEELQQTFADAMERAGR